jgi:hypothetical protein
MIGLFLVISSCHRNPSSSIVEINIKKALQAEGVLRLSEVASEVELIPLHNLDNHTYIQHTVNQYSIGDKVICVINARPYEILLFTRDGDFISKIGHQGKGPGEYMSDLVSALNEKDSTILIADNSQRKFLIYNYSGKCLKEKFYKTYRDKEINWIGDIILNQDGNYLLDNEWLPSDDGKCYHMLVMNRDLEIIKGICPGTAESGSFQMHINSQRMQEYQGGIRYLAKSKDTVHGVTENYSCTPTYRLINPDKDILDDFGNSTHIDAVSISGFLETSHYVLIEGEKSYRRFLISYNKETGQANSLRAPEHCWFESFGIENDLFGLSPLSISDFSTIDKGKLILILHPGIMDVYEDDRKEKLTDCLMSTKVLLPGKRDELASMIRNMDDNSGPILILITLK